MPTPDLSVAPSSQAEATDAPLPLHVGKLIGGKYQIKRVLGVGGNGSVYEGEHTTVGHRVAIKVVHPTRANREDIMARFRQEARICGTLRHPNVGQIYDVGTLDDGRPFMVMELQEGRSLAEIIDETVLPIAAVINISRQLLAGLGAAHRAGTIHRDVKPDNVMIVRDEGGDVIAKLVDFGISKTVASENEGRRVTGAGMIVGSPDYMSPEQLCGDDLDIRTDLYSAGVLLYESITGRTPFDGKSLSELIASVMRDAITPPTKIRPDCPIALERVVLRALARDPAKRFQTADEMSRALAEVGAKIRSTPMSLASLSEPPRSALSVSQTKRKRTIDNHTLEVLRQSVRPAGGKSPRRLRLAASAAGLAFAVALVWLGTSRDAAPSTSIVTRTQPQAPTETRAAPQVVVLQPEVEAPALTAIAAEISVPANAAPAHDTPPPPPRREPVRTKPSATRATGPVIAQTAPQELPNTLQLLKQASSAYVMGQTAQARTLYEGIVRSAPQQADAWRGLGLSASKMGARAEAARAFQRYLALRPNAADAPRIREQLAKVQEASR